MQVEPYLFFNGRCEEALEYYRETLGAEITMMVRFKEIPEADAGMVTPENENKIMHSNVRIGQSEFMASDGRCSGETNFEGFSLSIAVPDEAEAERLFGLLSESGAVRMPMEQTFFASRFGAVDDKFGVSWMVMAAKN